MSTRPSSTTAQTPTEPPGETESEPDELPLDLVFDLLSNERRRRIFRYLRAESEETTLGDLAEHIASRENDKPKQALLSQERKRVYICLYQAHLPKMSDAGVIEFDEDRKTIEVGENVEQVTRFLPHDGDTGAAQDRSGVLSVMSDVIRSIGSRLRREE